MKGLRRIFIQSNGQSDVDRGPQRAGDFGTEAAGGIGRASLGWCRPALHDPGRRGGGCGRTRHVLAQKILGAAVAASVVAVAWPLTTGVAAAAGDSLCPDVEVVFARGTFEDPGIGRTGQAFVDAVTNRMPGN
ncbi:hypothetical protein B1790_25810 [Mycobacterium sp. AT1]|nr:cutinase family protein [Mycobacterium sp. AT1]OPX06822.1 hypothetical protein B1790_25810 [Mycobacterium sp. AT1]